MLSSTPSTPGPLAARPYVITGGLLEVAEEELEAIKTHLFPIIQQNHCT